MKFRKFGVALVAGLAVVSLAACGKPANETVIESTKTILEAKQLDTSTKISLDVSTNAKDIPAEEKQMLEMVKNFALTVDSKVDKTAKKEEATIGVKFKTEELNMDFSIPLFADYKTNKMYVKANNLSSILGMMGMDAAPFEQFEGKVIELNGEDSGVNFEEELKAQKEMNKVLLETLKNLPEDKFTKEKDVYSVTLSGNDVIKFINSMLDEMVKVESLAVAQEDVDMMKEAMKEVNLQDSKIILSYTLDGKDIKKQNLKFVLDVKNPENEKEYVKATINVDTTVKSINKKVDFKFDTSKDNVVPQAEIEKAMEEYYNSMFMTDDMMFEEDVTIEDDAA